MWVTYMVSHQPLGGGCAIAGSKAVFLMMGYVVELIPEGIHTSSNIPAPLIQIQFPS